MKKYILFSIIFFGVLFFAKISWAANYYVSTAGNDANSGTEASPWRTIQHGLDLAQPGETIVVLPGTYTAGGTFPRSGASGSPISLKAQNPATLTANVAQRSVIRGSNGMGSALVADGKSYLTIEGFEIYDFETGVELDYVDNLILRNNILKSNTGVGIQCWYCDNSTFEGNHFIDPGPPYPELMDAIQDYGLNFYYAADNVVQYNYFWGKHNQALSWKRRAGPGIARYNWFEGCMYTCIYLGQNDDDQSGDMTCTNLTAENNYFRDSRDPDTGGYYRTRTVIALRNVNGATIRNNVFVNSIERDVGIISSSGMPQNYVQQNNTWRSEPMPTTDICPNMPWNQAALPAGWVKDSNGNCVGAQGDTTPPAPPTGLAVN